MAREVKAIIGLARGRVAYFEPLSNVMIDLANPVAYVYEGTNTSELRSALGGAIYVISGSLHDEAVAETAPVIEEKVPEIAQIVEEKPEAVEKQAEVIVEESKEVVAEVAPAKKVTAKKKK